MRGQGRQRRVCPSGSIVRRVVSALAGTGVVLVIAAQATCGDGATGTPPEPNRAPQPTGAIASLEVAFGASATVSVAGHFRDPDGDPLTFAAASSDPGIAAAAVTGSAVTARAVSRGTAIFTVTATDPGGLSARQTFEVSVPNRGPEAVGVIEDRRLEVGDSVTIGVAAHFSDPEGDPLALAAASSDPEVAQAAARSDSVLIVAAAKGEATVTVTARDPGGETAEQSFDVTVPNRGPIVADTIPADSLLLGDTLEVRLTSHFADPDGDSLSFAAESSEPAVATARLSGSTLVVVPMAPGRTTVTVTASDPDGLSAAQSFDVSAAHPNRAPVAEGEIPDRTIYVGSVDSVDVSSYFSDPDGDSLDYTAETSRRIRVTVAAHGSIIALSAESVGSSTVTVTASDPDGLAATQRFRAVVEPVPAPDLVVDTPTVDRDSVQVGGEFTVTAVVRNQGNAEAQSLNTLRLYESFDSRITSNDPQVAADSVIPLGAGQATEVSVRVEGPSFAGTRFYGVCVDSPPNETNTRNNCSAGVPVVFWQPNRAPLPRDSIRAPTLEPGDTFRTSLGRFFIDPDRDPLRYAAESSDASIATTSISGNLLTVEAKAPGVATITVTARDVTTRRPGSFTATQRFEVSVRLRPRPDLVVDLAQDSFSIGPQHSFFVNAVVRNEGTRDVPSGTTVRFFLSSDTTIGTADTEVGSVTLGALPESGRETTSVSLTSPAAVGIHYYGACVEAVDEETRTDNNCSGALAVLVDEEKPPNRAPRVERTFRDLTDTIPGRRYRAYLGEVFSDPDDDPLAITAESSDEAVVRTEVVGDSIYLYTIDFGSATITVTATDPAGLSASTSFLVTISPSAPPSTGFSMLFFAQTTMPEAQRAPIRAAVRAWEAILAETDLPDVDLGVGFDCAGIGLPDGTIVDDHLFIAVAANIDGPGGTLALAGFCAQRSGGGFPIVSRAIFDAVDIDRLISLGSLGDVAFHEIAHGLGFIGGRLSALGLLNTDPEPHFTGSGARTAFDAAGGTSYTGAKVPLSSPDLSHWHEDVFDVEIMTPQLEAGVPQPVSAITLAAMADMGYVVNLGFANAYRLPTPRPPLADRERPRHVLDLSGDVDQGPVTILGADGRVLDIIPAPRGYVPPAGPYPEITLDLRSPGTVRRPPVSRSLLDPAGATSDSARTPAPPQVTWIRDPYPAVRRPEAPSRRPR